MAQEQQVEVLFPKIFTHITNNNGYEEFVRAVDDSRTIPDVNAAMSPGATLTEKRRVINSQQAREAIELIKMGLQKPVHSPRTAMDENTTFPELSGFRHLGRLMGIQIYVDLADGHVSSAIENLRIGLEFANRVQTDTLISGLVGIAIEAIAEKSFSTHLDQLSYYDCENLLRAMQERLSDEAPGARVFTYEGNFLCSILEHNRTNMDGLIEMLNDETDDSPTSAATATLLEGIRAHPDQLSSAISSVEDKIKQNYAIAIDNLSLPMDRRKPYLQETSNSLDAMLFNSVSIDPGNIVDRYIVSRTKLHMLALHAVIRKYRWEHGILPGSLAVLHRPELTIDPMTGKPFNYIVKGEVYTLSAVGLVKRDENGEPLPQRDMLTLQ